MAEAQESGEHRVAVVFIHGQGQQRPMEDVRELARTVWDSDPMRAGEGGVQARSWLVPDARLGLADLGRVTTAAVQSGLRVDFFELYWAHLMADNRARHLLTWFRSLQARPRREAPPSLLPVRQGVIRFIECITLMTVIFTYSVGLLLPPSRDELRLTSETLRPLWLPTPDDLAWYFGLGALVLLALAIAMIFFNEASAGAKPKAPRANAMALRTKAMLVIAAVWFVPLLTVLAFAVVIVLGVLQGPTLQWGDARALIFVFALSAAALLALRRLEQALYFGLTGAAAALVCALFGGVAERNAADLIGAEAIRPDWVAPLVNSFSAGLLERIDGWVLQYLPHVLLGVFLFAAFWFGFGLISIIAKSRIWLLRILFAALIAAAGAWLGYVIPSALFQSAPLTWVMYTAGVALVFAFAFTATVGALAINSFLVPVMADSARYLSRGPDHVDARRRIRQAGIELLDRLHGPDSGYQRVIVVAHSLGTVVGYELLLDYWARFSGTYVMSEGDRLYTAMRDVEQKAWLLNQAPADPARVGAFRNAQREVSAALRDLTLEKPSHGAPEGKNWLITDFITLGSPLTHSSLLMADGKVDFWQKMSHRELSACPPVAFGAEGGAAPGGSFTFRGWDGKERPNHSSVFSAVRWTNHYFRAGEFIFVGDVIGGPLAAAFPPHEAAAARAEAIGFGAGIRDVELNGRETGQVFAHNEYWRSALHTKSLCEALRDGRSSAVHIAQLIGALDLDERVS